MHEVTFFTKPDCGLCKPVLFVLQKVRLGIPFHLEIVDITAAGNEIWFEAYQHDIPVVHVDGSELCRHRLSEKSFRAALAE